MLGTAESYDDPRCSSIGRSDVVSPILSDWSADLKCPFSAKDSNAEVMFSAIAG